MTPDEWRRVKDALSAVMKQPPAERPDALDAVCGGDAALRREIDELLASRDAMGGFLEDPIFGGVEPPVAGGIPDELLRWTRYTVIERLGNGGMADVYKAWDPRLKRVLAVKVISERDVTTVARFVREAEAQARVEHDNVLRIFETGVIGAHHYIAMQFVDGPTLLGVRDDTTVDGKVRLMLQIAEGLHAAHRTGLVHRDIKPGNILVERGPDGPKAYLLDFGLAADVETAGLTQTGVIVGTPRYMAPERVRGGHAALDRRSDIYGLGATFYELLACVAPFRDSSGLQVLVDVLERDLPSVHAACPTLPVELSAVIDKCLRKDPHDRYPSARLVADDLRRYLDGEPVLARPRGLVDRVRRKARRYPRLAASFALLAVSILGSAGWAAYESWHATRESRLAAELSRGTQDIEWLYRAAQMSPLHAIAAQKTAVRDRMDGIRRLLDAGGSLAFGPANYALGRGYQTLRDPSQALTYLQRAWNAGYRPADAAMALGVAHADLFRGELARAQRIDDDRTRAARVRAIETEHRDAAVALLAQGRASAIFPARYVDALIAASRGQIADAAHAARDAARETPWLFEARLLPAQLYFNEAVRVYLAGEIQNGAASAAEADVAFADAGQIAPSSIEAHVGRCAVAGLLLHMIMHGLVRDPTPPLRQAEDSCSRALVVDPDDVDANRYYAEALVSWANTQVLMHQSPMDAYARAAPLAEKAVRLSGGAVDARLALADVFMNRGWWESRSGIDPRASIDRALAEFGRVIAADPRNISAVENTGQTLILRYRYEEQHGIDPSASEGRVIDIFEHTLRIDPSDAITYPALTHVALERADGQRRHGADAGPGLQDVIGFLESLPPAPRPDARDEALRRLRDALAER